jgi:hypothetical protein
VAAHDCCDRCEVGRAAGRGVEDGRDLAEVVGAEDPGGDDRERLRVDVLGVVEVVDGAAGDPERLAAADVGRRALDYTPLGESTAPAAKRSATPERSPSPRSNRGHPLAMQRGREGVGAEA